MVKKISKISLFVLTQLTNVTDTHTDTHTPHDGIGRAYMHRMARQKWLPRTFAFSSLDVTIILLPCESVVIKSPIPDLVTFIINEFPNFFRIFFTLWSYLLLLFSVNFSNFSADSVPSRFVFIEYFCRAMLCIIAAYAIMRCLSVCLSVCVSVTFDSCVKMNKDIFEIFSPSGSQAILVFPCQTGWRYSDGNPP